RRAFQGVGLPADDLVGLAAVVAAALPLLGPEAVGRAGLADLLVEVVGLAVPVGVDAEVDGHDRRVARLDRAEGLGVPRADALDEVVPQGAGVGVVPLGRAGVDVLAAFAPVLARRGGAAADLLRDDAEAVALEHDRAGVAADDLRELGVVAHRRRDDDLAPL